MADNESGIAVYRERGDHKYRVYHDGVHVISTPDFERAMLEAGVQALAYPETLIAVVVR